MFFSNSEKISILKKGTKYQQILYKYNHDDKYLEYKDIQTRNFKGFSEEWHQSCVG